MATDNLLAAVEEAFDAFALNGEGLHCAQEMPTRKRGCDVQGSGPSQWQHILWRHNMLKPEA